MTPTQAGFPHVAQAAEMLRFCERKTEKEQEVEREYLLTSLTADELNPHFSKKVLTRAVRCC